MKQLTDERIQELLGIGNPSEEACRLIRTGWNAALNSLTGEALPAREWVGLTEKELWLAIDGCANKYEACRVVMSRLREKNAGQPAADDKAGGEPVWWVVVDEAGLPEFITIDRQMAQDHINDALQEHDCIEAAQWTVRPVYTRPQPQAIPPGYALVPVEPTEEMTWAARDAYTEIMSGVEPDDLDAQAAAYRAMLAAAPKPQESRNA